MDPPLKKQHLTQQFLMKVARKEGLGWEADLADHGSKILSAYKLLIQYPGTRPVLEKVAPSKKHLVMKRTLLLF